MATLVEIAAQLVSSHAASTPMTSDELLAEITKVHAALKSLESGQSVAGVGAGTEEIKPTLTLKEAFKKNEIVCLICGKGGFKTLARHLSTAHDTKPGAYKKQFGIPSKQVLAAKSYSESRRRMALEGGLADNLAKAREVRMGNIEAKKVAPLSGPYSQDNKASRFTWSPVAQLTGAVKAKRGRPAKAVVAGKVPPKFNIVLVDVFNANIDSFNASLKSERSAKAPAKAARAKAAPKPTK